MTEPAAGVIIRTRDKAGVLGRAIDSVRAQSVEAEIVVVDSGSTDGTLEVARTYAVRVVQLEDFSFGRALNAGAEAASAPVHVALSAHCWLPRRDWLERALTHYEDRAVAAATGGPTDPGGAPLSGAYALTSRAAVRPGSVSRTTARAGARTCGGSSASTRRWRHPRTASGCGTWSIRDAHSCSTPHSSSSPAASAPRARGSCWPRRAARSARSARSERWSRSPAPRRCACGGATCPPQGAFRGRCVARIRIARRGSPATGSARATPERPVDGWFRPALRLALFCDRFPELSETFVSGEVRELRRQGVDVTVYAGPPNTRDWSWDDDVPVQPLATATGRRLRSLAPLARLALTRPRALAGDLRDRRTCAREKRVTPLRRLAPALQRLRREGTHHIHVHFAAGAALDALRAERLTGIPFSVTAHAYELFGTPANLAAKIGEAAFVTVPCAYNLQQLERRGLPTGRTRVRMLGTDTRAVRRMAPLPDDGLTLAVGRLVEKKGFHVLVEAAARRELGPVCIVGDGPWRARLEELIRAHGLQDRVTLAGAAAPRDIRGWMERAGVMVIPSVVTAGGDQDALPVVAWEALAMELPVVATAVAGLPEVVLPPWGRVVGPGDPDALADAIAAWRAAPYDGRVAAGRAGREWLERNHTQERAVAGLLEQIDPRARVRAGGR